MGAVTTTAALHRKNIILGVSGSVAAYKAALVLRLLHKAGASVSVILTESASKFIGAETFSGLGATVYQSPWGHPGELHVQLAEWAHAFLIVPASADALAKMAEGRADDLLSLTFLCANSPVFVAPAMHPRMYTAPATAQNVHRLRARGVTFLGPVDGEVASGASGLGRMEEPEHIVSAVSLALLGPRLLSGRRLVITAGPTSEPIDPVRSITNASSGKMGFAIAEQAALLGAQVTLIAGPVNLPSPPLVTRIDVTTALEMQTVLHHVLGDSLTGTDALIMAAAVSDYRPKTPSERKLHRRDGSLALELVPNPDLLKSVGSRRTSLRPVLVGFALETVQGDALIQRARRKLVEKKVDLVVANTAAEALGRDTNSAMLVTAQDCRPLGTQSKGELATDILRWVAARLETDDAEWTS